MTTVAHRHKHNSHGMHKKASHLFNGRTTHLLRPLKKINRNIASYVYKKPYKSIGIATLVVGAVLGFIYANIRK